MSTEGRAGFRQSLETESFKTATLLLNSLHLQIAAYSTDHTLPQAAKAVFRRQAGAYSQKLRARL
jgi:hypothetical protein